LTQREIDVLLTVFGAETKGAVAKGVGISVRR
jgi:hypothetical protein